MVDRTFSEWDKASMFIYLHQAGNLNHDEANTAEFVFNREPLKANFSLLLSLSIIPVTAG